MKKISTLLLFSSLGLAGFAQPIIQNADNHITNGSTFAASAAASVNGPGSGGANVTWDFSGLSTSSLGALTYVDPTSTPFASSFSTSNYSLTVSGRYSYFRISASKIEVMAYTILQPGDGNDYSPNPRTLMSFPFSYGSSATDTWQKVGQSVNSVTVTYDGYGTLKTPGKTYQNVVRIKESYNDGDDYQWYSVNPFMNLMTYSHGSNMFYFLDGASNSVNELETAKHISLFPNPSNGQFSLNFIGQDGLNGSERLLVTNSLGALVYNQSVENGQQSIDLSANGNGLYFYQFIKDGIPAQTGRLMINN